MAPPTPSSSSATTTSVQVAVRIRPTTSADTASIPARFQRTVIHATSPTSVAVDATSSTPSGTGSATAVATTASSNAAAKKQVFSFDQVHASSATQHAMFTSTAQPLISRFLEGFNCTILAYGQTSSGKTFTMTGIDLDADPSDPNNGMGIIPRAVSTIFARARKLKEERGQMWNYSLKGSFIEIYNEDLIDLLSDDGTGARREVQIREDKDGHIIWGGLREIQVKNSNEVMTLIRQGTSIRRTNETDMNAQSSRSHAIFSLTLTQKRYTGSGPPPRASSPLPPGGRSPSRLARPGSVYATGSVSSRVSSPTPGRPSTPSFASAMSRGGLRPASAMGMSTSDARADDESGEWVTVVSKFHFVDLAGSERLKRTAAAGERIKEGISINSGLLALGNVISALGDPSRAKTHTASHVPYRDSKLTRLLQDSLGGNAHTLMIACVSPTEWNTAETVNTLKYANRARNIKNRAVVNEKEDGWDDIEWLQGTVARLRKEVKGLKDGTALLNGRGSADIPEVPEGASKRMLSQMTDLQNNYEDLREKFVERTEELTRLRRELGERHRSSTAGAVTGTAKYEEIVGPVIEEYEKTINAMEAELSLNRAALRHTNDLVEEKEEELAVITERHSATELYVEELRSRVAKLTEREASTEAYVRDLEEKIKGYDETTLSSSESMTDLKRELSRYKDAEAHSTKYIADVEARLARSDESVLSLQQNVEHLEQECERRRDEVDVLQSRLNTLKQDGTSWKDDLEARERKLRLLELKMEEWERKKQEASEDRQRLGVVMGEVTQARKSLEDLSVPETNGAGSGTSTPSATNTTVEDQLLALQQTHTATLADLSSVTAKYRDALREISDLAAQIQEAKVSNTIVADPPAPLSALDIPPFRRRMTAPRSKDGSEVHSAPPRSHFFRQAASTESLHSRSLSQSQSLSQELYSARTRKASISSHGTSSSVSHSSPSLFAPAAGLHVGPNERSISSLEKEIMRLQEVLKDREAEIAVLELSLKNGSSQGSAEPVDADAKPDVALSPKMMHQFDAIRKSMVLQNGHAPLENGHVFTENGHVPTENGSVVDGDESLDRLNELMLSMAQKESAHRDLVDGLNEQLAQLRRQHDELNTLSRDQAMNMSNELETLRGRYTDDLAKLEQVQAREVELTQALKDAEADHAEAMETIRREHEEALRAKETEMDQLISRLKEDHKAELTSLRAALSEAVSTLAKAHEEHTDAFGKLKEEHEEDLRRRLQEADDLLTQTREQYEAILAKVNKDHEEVLKSKEAETSASLQRTEEEYYEALTALRNNHTEAMDKQVAEAAATLAHLREEHAAQLRMAEIAREGSLSESQSERAAAVQQLQEEHTAAIARKETIHMEEIENVRADHAQVLSQRESDYSGKLERLKAKHANALVVKTEEHEAELEALRHENEVALRNLNDAHFKEVESLSSALAQSQEELKSALDKARVDQDAALQELREQQAMILHEIERAQQESVSHLTITHETALKDAIAKVEEERTSLLALHTEELTRLRREHQEAVAGLDSSLVALQDQHRSDLEAARQRSEELLSVERQNLATTLEDLEQKHSQERATLHKDREMLAQELETQKATTTVLEQERAKLASAVAEGEKQYAQEIQDLRLAHDGLLKELETHKSAAANLSANVSSVEESHAKALDEKTAALGEVRKELEFVHSERDELEAEVAQLRAELDKTRGEQSKLIQEASKRESLVSELERHRSVLADIQEDLQRVKDEKDTIQAERNRQESTLRELQAQMNRIAAHSEPVRPATDRSMSFSRAVSIPAMKPPPPTPPPLGPPPPVPRSASVSKDDAAPSPSTQPSTMATSASSNQSAPDSPHTSFANSSVNGHVIDSKLTARLEEQAKQIEEQEVMIKTLNKQLSHCESDLQAHMDLVTTLETSLGDSEKNLRKARMHATELARERDSLNNQIEALRGELQQTKREVDSVRKSIVEEKQSLEHRIDEERRAKERARAQLDTRMEELQKRKSKFACL